MDKFKIPHKNILLDVGDTLVSIDEPFEKYTRRAIGSIYPFYEKAEPSLKDFLTTVLGIRREIRADAHRTLYEYSFLEFIEKVNRHYDVSLLDIKKVEERYISAELEITKLKHGVHDFLKRGKQANKRFVIATNNFSSLHVARIIELFELKEFIEEIYISGEIHVRKPSKVFIDRICEELNLEKSETIIIGDKQEMDIKAANLSGIDSCFINLSSPDYGNLNDPTFHIRSLEQVIFS